LNFTLDSLTVADDYSAKEDRFFYAHDAESLSLYVVLLCLAFANFKIDLADAGSNAARKCAAVQEIGSRWGIW
jgi:hypothetical protein